MASEVESAPYPNAAVAADLLGRGVDPVFMLFLDGKANWGETWGELHHHVRVLLDRGSSVELGWSPLYGMGLVDRDGMFDDDDLRAALGRAPIHWRPAPRGDHREGVDFTSIVLSPEGS